MDKPSRQRRGRKQFDFGEQEETPKTASHQERQAKQQGTSQPAQEELPVIRMPMEIFLDMRKEASKAPQYLENEARLTDTFELVFNPAKAEKFLEKLEGFKLLKDRLWVESSDNLLKIVAWNMHCRIDDAKKNQMKVTWLDCCHALLIGPLPDPNPHLQVDTEFKLLLHRKQHMETVAHERRDEAIGKVMQQPMFAEAVERSYQEKLEVEDHIRETFTIARYKKIAQQSFSDEITEYEKEAFKKIFVRKCDALKKVDRQDPTKVFVPLPCVFRIVRKAATLEKNTVCCWNPATTPKDEAEHKLMKETDFVMRKWKSAKVQSQVSDQQAVVSFNEHRDLDLLHRLIYGNSMKEKNESDYRHTKLDRSKNTIVFGDSSKQFFISPDICLRSKALLKLRELLSLERFRQGITLEEPEEPVDAVELISLAPGKREEKKMLAERAKAIPEDRLMEMIKNALNHKIRVDNLFSLYEGEEPLEKVTLVDVITNGEFLAKRVLGLKK